MSSDYRTWLQFQLLEQQQAELDQVKRVAELQVQELLRSQKIQMKEVCMVERKASVRGVKRFAGSECLKLFACLKPFV